MKERKFLPTIEDLIDRLTIFQLKEVFLPEHKGDYAKDIQDILHDIDIILEESPGKVNAKLITGFVVDLFALPVANIFCSTSRPCAFF